ncbi:MAG: COX15/CtaA family protein [Rhodoblastus sp.]|nr:MAG: COX15/CtaA family protein [Rhodoblastus sp.]
MNGKETGGALKDARAIRIWLWSVAALIFVMVLVGGATRLTESGLSITEWKPIAGALPPLSEADWSAEFEKYKQIPQYRELNAGMTLAQFKTIYFWEWGHRLLGRLIGLAFALPLLVFWLRGALSPRLRNALLAVLALGALQGAVGWWMVKSGLVGRIEVAQERLAIHLLLASVTMAAIAWIAVGLRPPADPAPSATPPPCAGARALLALTLVQIGLGALVAGLRAGYTYNTWPLMDGRFVPPWEHLAKLSPVWLNLLDNPTTVQFQHRMVGYALAALALAHFVSLFRLAPGKPPCARARALLGLVLVQIMMGVVTLLSVVQLHVALTHQAVAMAVLLMATVHARRLSAA